MNSKILIIISVFFFSVILWVFVSFSEEYSIQISFPVDLKTNSSLYKVSSFNPSELNFTIKGKGWQLIKFAFGYKNKYRIWITSSKDNDKILSRNYLKYNSWLTNLVQVISVEPEVISIKIEKGLYKKVLIKPDIDITYKEGFGLVSDIKIIPDSLMIYGPSSRIALIQSISTDKIKLNNVEENQNLTVKLRRPDFINIPIQEVEISFEVEKIVDRQIDDVQVEIINLPLNKDLILSAQKISLILKGGIQKLANLKSSDILAQIDYNDAINDSLGFLIPEVSLPNRIDLIEIKPNKLKYIIKEN